MNWREFSKRLLLLDNRINDVETAMLRRAILADGKVDRAELEFLLDLKRSAGSVHPEFDRFLAQVLKKVVLADHGTISDAETRWLRDSLFKDCEITEAERELLRDLKREAKHVGPEFKRLYEQIMASHAEDFSRG